jgi:hypothetical protein
MASLGKVLAGVVHTMFPAAAGGVEKPVQHLAATATPGKPLSRSGSAAGRTRSKRCGAQRNRQIIRRLLRPRCLAGSFPAPDKASSQISLRDLNGLAYLRKSYWLARAEQPDSASDESTYAKRESRMAQVAIAQEQTALENRKGQGCD